MKQLIVNKIKDGSYYKLFYTKDEAKHMTPEEKWVFTKQQVHELLAGDSFAHSGHWVAPNDVCVAHFSLVC